MARLFLVALCAVAAVAIGSPVRAMDDTLRVALEGEAEAAATAHAHDLLQDATTPVIGNPDAKVTIVEFFDYQCPYCKAAEPRLEALIKENKNVKLVIKEFPILSPESIVAAKAALASIKQGKYTEYHQAMMNYRGRIQEANVFEIAATVGLDVDRLRRDMNSPEIADEIIKNMSLARAVKISVVPGLLVNTHVLSGVTNQTVTAKIDFKQEVAQAH